jgi:threonine aldolase
MTTAEPIDLRSDTLTRPDAAMRRAMAEAEVGDDVYGEDPTVARLEAEAAEAIGFAAALFVPSGTMGNQIALRLLAPRGSELLCDERAHVVLFEQGGMSALSGIQPRPLPSADGLPALEAFRAACDPRGVYRLATGALALENTHNWAGGRVFGRARLEPILELARGLGLAVHLDGARIWNAAVALDRPVAELTRGFETVMFCLSKGLGAPVGSLLCGSVELIREARAVRGLFGGAMRQAGVIAAAGRLALREGPRRLADDHARARRLAEALAGLPEIDLDPAAVETNIGIFRVRGRGADGAAPAESWVARAAERGVRMSSIGPEQVRFVTHRDVSERQLDEAIARLLRRAA